MHVKKLYESIYRYWGETTPLFGDCGALCDKACCENDPCADEETGMYLFPGENALFSNNNNFEIVPSDFEYADGTYADLLICKGPCSRELRPLSCRIFPLIPYYRKDTGLKIIIDPRAKHLCPLAQKKALSYYDPAFQRKVEKTFRMLLCFREVRSYLEGLSDILDDFMKFDTPEDSI